MGSVRDVNRAVPLVVSELRSQVESGFFNTPSQYLSPISLPRFVGGMVSGVGESPRSNCLEKCSTDGGSGGGRESVEKWVAGKAQVGEEGIPAAPGPVPTLVGGFRPGVEDDGCSANVEKIQEDSPGSRSKISKFVGIWVGNEVKMRSRSVSEARS